MGFLLLLHLVGVIVWVGGMFFSYMVLRPASAEILEAPERLPLWNGVLRRFFSWVWIAIAAILGSGLAMIALLGGFAAAGLHVHVMLAFGVVMMLIFAHVFFAGYGRLKRYVGAREWKAAGSAMAQIRMLVGLNLILGFITVAVATLGRLA